MLDKLDERFKIKKEWKDTYDQFLDDCAEYIGETKTEERENQELGGTSAIELQLRQELARIDKEIAVRQKNREKILAALNAISSLEVEETE